MLKVFMIIGILLFASSTYAAGFLMLSDQPVGKIMLTDGMSFMIQTDGTSKVCLEGGC